jgi:hypothetical protein
LCCIDAALTGFHQIFQSLDLASCHDVSAAAIEFLLGFQLIDGLLQRASCLIDLAFRRRDFGLALDYLGLDLGDAPSCCFKLRSLLGIVQPENWSAFFDAIAELDIDFRDPAVGFRYDRG